MEKISFFIKCNYGCDGCDALFDLAVDRGWVDPDATIEDFDPYEMFESSSVLKHTDEEDARMSIFYFIADSDVYYLLPDIETDDEGEALLRDFIDYYMSADAVGRRSRGGWRHVRSDEHFIEHSDFTVVEQIGSGGLFYTYVREGEVASHRRGDGLYGYMSSDGEWVIEPMFAHCDGKFAYGTAAVQMEGGGYGVIDIDGRYHLAPVYGSVHRLENGAFMASADKRNFGYADSWGFVVDRG